ncbi:MAG: hypothetical protein M3155_08115 [Actinomycetota bacterium]|nr:hypothetical protein [Actinomycetota bacterium]
MLRPRWSAVASLLVVTVGLGVWLAASPGRRHASHAAPRGDRAVARSIAEGRARNRSAYRYDLVHGARIVPSPATGTYTVESTAPARPRAVVVVVHGHNGNTFAEYRLWQPYVSRHGYGLMAVEWQPRFGAQPEFLDPRSTYAMIARALRAHGIGPGRALLHGFSMGSHAAFALAALDHAGSRLFALTIAESGGARDLPASPAAFGGTRWVLYCAGRDQWPDISGCPAMRRAERLLRASRARIDRFLVDPPAKHGGFLLNPREVEVALADFAHARAP